jgi:hypothetical protein
MKLMAQSRIKADWPADLEIFDEMLRVALRQARYSLSPWPSSLSLDAYRDAAEPLRLVDS